MRFMLLVYAGETDPGPTLERVQAMNRFNEELVGGYWIIRAESKDEAVAWASRAPVGDGTIEVRQIAEGDDYGPEIAGARRLSTEPPEQTVAE
jgi:hypothetical protein